MRSSGVRPRLYDQTAPWVFRLRRPADAMGFDEEGRLRQAFVVGDRSFDDLMMAILIDERFTPERENV
jgi:RimJ/RimL family protein N-acetyltransferase